MNRVVLLVAYEIQKGNKMNDQQQYICGRNENPETCFLCEQEGKDYCMICADAFTEEDYETIQKHGLPF